MIDRPHRYIEEFARYADLLGFHYEAGSDNAELLKKIRKLGCKSCITIKPATPAEAIFDLLPLCDMVLVMSVEPGFGGQSYIHSVTDKISSIKKEVIPQMVVIFVTFIMAETLIGFLLSKEEKFMKIKHFFHSPNFFEFFSDLCT